MGSGTLFYRLGFQVGGEIWQGCRGGPSLTSVIAQQCFDGETSNCGARGRELRLVSEEERDGAPSGARLEKTSQQQ